MAPSSPPLHAVDDETPSYVGKLVAGKYQVVRVIGDGGMGAVFQATNVAVGRSVALKVLRPSFARQSDAVERFQREARAAARIGHPGIIEILDMGRTEEGLPFIVMELLEGEELFSKLQREAPFTPSFAIRIMEQVLGALGAAHAVGIVHRDLKPENVFLVEHGPQAGLVKILDFGIAKFQDGEVLSNRITRAGLLVGTPAYMSPEQALAGWQVDPRSDVYSAGVLLYEMLSGQLPHEGESFMQIAVAVASRDPRPLGEVATWLEPELCAVVARAMAREPAGRHATVEELAEALAPFRGDTSVGSVVVRGRLPSRRVSGLRSSRPPSGSGSVGTATTIVEDTLTPAPDALAAAAPVPSPARSRGVVGGVLAAVVLVLAMAAVATTVTEGEPPRAAVAPAKRAPRPAPATPTPAPPPTATPAPSPNVTLQVAANVAHARVRLDGVLIGETPLHEIVPRGAGRRLLSVEADGHVTVERSVELDADRAVEVVLDVAPVDPASTARTKAHPRAGLLFDRDPYR